MSNLSSLLARYGYGDQAPDPGADEVYSTADVLRRMPGPLNAGLRNALSYLPENKELPPPAFPFDPRAMSMLDIIKKSGRTSGNWVLDRNPEVGPDTVSPAGLGVAAAGAGLARHAMPLPSPLTPENITDKLARWGKATALHQRSEAKRDNAWGFPMGMAAIGLEGASLATGHGSSISPFLAGPLGGVTYPHFADIRDIARYLRGTELREARKQPLSDNSGFTLSADNAKASAPGLLANAAEQRPTAGRTPTTERGAALERGREDFHQTLGEHPGTLTNAHPLEMPSGHAAGNAHQALLVTKGNIPEAISMVERWGEPGAANVIRYWQQSGRPTRPYADAGRAMNYWRALDDFGLSEPPARLNANPASASLPSALSNTQPGRETAPSFEDLLRRYGSQF